MTNEVKEFIEKHIDLIEAEEFKKLYDLTRAKITSREDPSFTGEFTETLLSAGIDPAKYMKEIPSHYLEQSSIQSYVVPHGVTSIGASAFSYCTSLTNITIPDGVTSIKRGAFSYCSSLMNITIPNTVTEISVEAFSSCTNLKSITYLGTKDQWNKIKLGRQWKTSSRRLKEIKCTDGTIIL